MKVHLFKNRLNEEFKMQCGYKIHGFNIDYYETIDHTKVTCEHCKKSQAYKYLKEANKSIEKIKNETVADFKKNNEATKKATYTQKIEIEIKVPVEMEVDIYKFTGKSYAPDFSRGTAFLNVSLKPKVKTGEELIGCLVEFSDLSEDENWKTRGYGIVKSFHEADYGDYYKLTDGRAESYVKLVSSEKLDEFKARLVK